MKKLAVIAIFLVFLLDRSGAGAAQDLKAFEPLKEPRIRTMPAQKMLVVETKGDPNTSAQASFSLLFKTFFSLPGVMMTAPRARWLGTQTTPKSEWVGLYALPLPDSVAGLPAGTTGARIEVWQYGEVAEILHLGGYDKEPPTIEKLLKFIAGKGYEVAGPHEEEYLKGPGMAPGPDDYWTIIRYQVKKK
jgi:hypothetical protein